MGVHQLRQQSSGREIRGRHKVGRKLSGDEVVKRLGLFLEVTEGSLASSGLRERSRKRCLYGNTVAHTPG